MLNWVEELDALKYLALANMLSETVAALYAMQSESAISMFRLAQAKHDVSSSVVLRFFVKDAVVSANRAFSLMNQSIDLAMTQASEINGLALPYLKNSSNLLKDGLLNQMNKDIESLKIDLFRDINSKGLQDSITRFVYLDKLGRRLKSESFIQSSVKMWLISSIYSAMIASATSTGKLKITLSNGESIDLTPDGLDSLSKYNHPNTKVLPISIS